MPVPSTPQLASRPSPQSFHLAMQVRPMAPSRAGAPAAASQYLSAHAASLPAPPAHPSEHRRAAGPAPLAPRDPAWPGGQSQGSSTRRLGQAAGSSRGYGQGARLGGLRALRPAHCDHTHPRMQLDALRLSPPTSGTAPATAAAPRAAGRWPLPAAAACPGQT